MEFDEDEPLRSNSKKMKVSSSEKDNDQRGQATSDTILLQELMMRIQEAEARAAAGVLNERIGELKIKTLVRALHIPEDELAIVLTGQEITDEELDRARGVTIEVRPGKPRTVTRTPTRKAGSLQKPPKE